MEIVSAKKSDYAELIKLWESSVRATHHFLSEQDIVRLRTLIHDQYFDAVDLLCAKDVEGQISGFCGVADSNLEMLFVAPESMGTGVGSALCQYVITNHHVRKVDVNEQNPKALGFYEHLGFTVVGRSDLDGEGNPFPLLHMKLTENT